MLTSDGTRLRIKVELMKASVELAALCVYVDSRADVRNCTPLSTPFCSCYKWCAARKVLPEKAVVSARFGGVYLSVRDALVCIIRENVTGY